MTDRFIDLRTARPADRITLRGVRVNAHLVGMTAHTVVEQLFVNEEPAAVEAVYTFPLPADGAVCRFEVVVGDRVLTGQVDEREKAIETYENAVNQGHGAFLLEQERPDIFTIRVGNLLPKQAAMIRLTYVQPLDVADNAIRFALPTTVAPRYVTATASDPQQMAIDADAINPPHVLSVPYGLTLAVHVDLGRQIRSIASVSHAIKTELGDGNQYRLSFAGGVSEMNRDVVIELKLARELQPSVQVGDGPDGAKYLAVSFLPEFDEQDLARREPADVMFVLDCSGSMGGESIEQAKVALELCLRSLSPGDRFNICRFGDSHELMNPEPLTYSDYTLKKALFYVHRIQADLGGTEVYAPLAATLLPAAKTVRQVILLTDGQVSNEQAVIELVRRHKGHNRVFSFGIGHASSQALVRGVARASGGAAEFIAPGENIADKVLRTFSRIASPALTEVEVDFGDADATVAGEIPPVFDGDVVTVFARVTGGVPKAVTLKARSAKGGQAWPAGLAASVTDSGIATLWARRMIDALEVDAEKHRERLIGLSKAFGVVCSLTAYVAVEHRSIEDRNHGRPALRRIPVQVARGWHGIDTAAMGAVACAPRRVCLSIELLCDTAGPAPSLPRDTAPSRRRAGRSKLVWEAANIASSSLDEVFASPLHQLLSLQTAEGWFDLDAAAKPLRDLFPPDKRDAADDPKVRHTIAALRLMRTTFAADEPVWKAAYTKAMRYLAKATGRTVAELTADLATA